MSTALRRGVARRSRPLRARRARRTASRAAADQAGSVGGGDEGAGARSGGGLPRVSVDEWDDSVALPANYCIIESRDTVQDFAAMELQDVKNNIEVRRNKIFLLMEEVRRLRIQERYKTMEGGLPSPMKLDRPAREFRSAIPGLPPLTAANIDDYRTAYGFLMIALFLFGGILAPLAELKLGVGGTSYAQFIDSIGLPATLGHVDPIVASFTGGAVGVITCLLFIEINNVQEQARKDCVYCNGKGYLGCAQCQGSGRLIVEGKSTACTTCTGTSKVMCVSCLSTGRALVSEHDPRIDPFGE